MTVEHTGIWLYSFSLTVSFIPVRAGRKDLHDSLLPLSEGCTTKTQVGARILYLLYVVWEQTIKNTSVQVVHKTEDYVTSKFNIPCIADIYSSICNPVWLKSLAICNWRQKSNPPHLLVPITTKSKIPYHYANYSTCFRLAATCLSIFQRIRQFYPLLMFTQY